MVLSPRFSLSGIMKKIQERLREADADPILERIDAGDFRVVKKRVVLGKSTSSPAGW